MNRRFFNTCNYPPECNNQAALPEHPGSATGFGVRSILTGKKEF